MTYGMDSIADLRKQVAGTELEAGIDYVLAQTHAARVKAVQKSVDFACNKLVKHRNKKQDDDEDGLTVQVCDMLTSSGVKAVHNGSISGHCDIVVEGKDDFLWLAEAKKHDDYAWLNKGFLQLSTRYSTGNPGQDHGDVIIYCKNQDAKQMLDKWRSELVARNASVSIAESVDHAPLIFHSTHKHESSGLDFHIRHKAVSLYWKPKD